MTKEQLKFIKDIRQYLYDKNKPSTFDFANNVIHINGWNLKECKEFIDSL